MTPSLRVPWLWVALVPYLVAPGTAAAQETRAAAIAEAQAEKAQQLRPYEPGTAERIASGFKTRFFETPTGFYPWFSSVYSGGGFTLGAGYRQFYGDRTFWDARGLLSIKGYKLFEVMTSSLGLATGVDLHAVGGWRDATQVAFYGVGSDTPLEGESNFRMKQSYVGAIVRARGSGPVVADLGIQYEDYGLEEGTGVSPSIEDVYTSDSAPGLGTSPHFLRLTMMGGIDWRSPAAGYARRGGLYAMTFDSYIDPDSTYSFDRLQAEVIQHIPILRENWVISLRGVGRTTIDDDDVVPYFLLPALGSGSTLRAYPSWRFRDRHSLLLQGEWRWIPNRLFLDMAIFYDAGKVMSRRADFNFEELKQDVGIGVRFHSALATPLRIELARGSEGFNLVFSGAAAF